MIQIKINNNTYDTISVLGYNKDPNWDNRKSHAITLNTDYATALSLFVNNMKWSLLQTEDIYDEATEKIMSQVNEYDKSEYSISGAITDNRDGSITIKMGVPTNEELKEKELKETQNALDAMLLKTYGD